MNGSSGQPLDPGGCCEAGIPEPALHNRPGLPALAYRIGTHPTFLRRMLARLPAQEIPDGPHQGTRPLAALTTRGGDDPAVALLDAWATVADVLTFYQERIADEGFLRTATERRSVLELARAIGYELRPGVAASTVLAFTVEDAPGAPGTAVVPAGTRVQSVPGPGQLPQAFETTHDIATRAEWNALRPRLTQPQSLDLDALAAAAEADAPYSVYLTGTGSNLKPGDLLLLAVEQDGATGVGVAHVQRVVVEIDLNRTRVDLAQQPAPPPPFVVAVAPKGQVLTTEVPMTQAQVKSAIVDQSLSEADLNALYMTYGWSSADLKAYLSTPPRPSLPPPDRGLFAFRARLGCFGHNAPLYANLPKTAATPDPDPNDWDAGGGRSIWRDSHDTPYDLGADADVFLERSLPEVVRGSWVVFESHKAAPRAVPYRVNGVVEVTRADYGVSARATGLTLARADGDATNEPDKSEALTVRTTTAYAQSEHLELAELPIEEPIPAGSTSLPLDRLVDGLAVGQLLTLGGECDDPPGVTAHEVVALAGIEHPCGFTVLTFAQGLQHGYVRRTLTLNANTARATHGETVQEVLGSGDGAQAHQRFALKRPPLTHVSAPTPSGAESTLEVRVDGVLWQPAPRLYGLDERAESYVVRIEDDGTAVALFGDGETGARLPSGTQNVVATYRTGIGLAGLVAADSLTLLQTRPLGVRGATNPLAATGADDPEDRGDARVNAPLTVLTLERVVSLRDYENFARAFAGIGKAQAVTLWDGQSRLISVTAAAANGGVVDPELAKNLLSAIEAAGDPGQRARVDAHQPVFFNLTAGLLIDARHAAATVRAAVEDALLAAFSFERRSFGQPVTAAEVLTVISGVPAVVAADLAELYRYGAGDGAAPQAPSLEQVLPAASARWKDQKAELLLINPAGIGLTGMAP